MTLREVVLAWHRDAVAPRLAILRLLPSGGFSIVALLVTINVLLGVLPIAFIVSTSALVGQIPAALSAGLEPHVSEGVARAFLWAAGCFTAQQLLVPFQNALGERLRRRVDGKLRSELVRIVMQGSSIAPMEDRNTLSALSEATRLLETAANTPGMACSGLLALVARYVRLCGLLGLVAAMTSFSAALALGAITMMFRYGQRGGLRKYSQVWRRVAGLSRRSHYLRELAMTAGAAKEIRIFGLTDWLARRYSESFLAAYQLVAARRRQVYQRPYWLFAPIGVFVAAAVMLALARDAASGQVPLRELATALQAAVLALQLGEFYAESDVPTQFGMQAVAALREVEDRLERPPVREVRALPAGLRQMPARSLRFANVSFRYPGGGRDVLNGLELELMVGKCTAVVGVNGAGKTTLVKLLTRLYEPTVGALLADDLDIAQLDPNAWRQQVSVIFQDFVRYELSAADNIALGAAHVPASRAEISRAADEAGILASFSLQPLGLDTPLGRAYTGGIELSGGQWQRIAIARSLYALRAGAKVLILDEPTSALDVRAEAAFFDRFVELTRGATSLLISHRFSSVRRADRIVVMDGGRVVEHGSHSELLARDGHYARLFRLQAERFSPGSATDARADQRLRGYGS